MRSGVVPLDGGFATALEAAGHDLGGGLWSARLLRDSPSAVLEVHRAYLDAGARVVETASYQATLPGFAADGISSAEALDLMRLSVTLARQAVSEAVARDGLPRWVAGSVGPYGAMLADGSEYTGAYGDMLDVDRLRAFHRPRLEALASAGVDVLACETVPARAEVAALARELTGLGVPGWISLTTQTVDGVALTRRGEPASAAYREAASSPSVIAVGVNCVSPGDVAPALASAAPTGLPLVAYPNSGETWDATAQTWTGTPHLSATDVGSWITSGARLLGGCCRVGPTQLPALTEQGQDLCDDHALPPGVRE